LGVLLEMAAGHNGEMWWVVGYVVVAMVWVAVQWCEAGRRVLGLKVRNRVIMARFSARSGMQVEMWGSVVSQDRPPAES
jgi:hypothetical protein